MALKYIILYLSCIAVICMSGEFKSFKMSAIYRDSDNVLISRKDFCDDFLNITDLFVNTNNVLLYDQTLLSCEKQLLNTFRGTTQFQTYYILNISILNSVLKHFKFIKHSFFIGGEYEFIEAIMYFAGHMDITSNQHGFLTFTHEWVLLPYDVNCDLLLDIVQPFNHVICIDSFNPYNLSSGLWNAKSHLNNVKSLEFVKHGEHIESIWTSSPSNKRSIFPNSKYKFNNRHFKIGSQQSSQAFFDIDIDDTTNLTSFTGIYYEVIQEIAKYLNMTFTIIIPEDGQFGHEYSNGSWSGLVGQLHRKEVDFVIAPITVSKLRRKVIDYADYPLDITYITGVYRMPNRTIDTLSLIFLPFNTHLWMGCLICIVLFSFIITLIEIKVNHRFIACFEFMAKSYLKQLYLAFFSLMQQSIFDKTKPNISNRVLWSGWLLFCMILLCVWSSNLISHLTVHKIVTPFETLSDLLEQDVYKYGVNEGVMSGLYFASSSKAPMKDIWKNMKRFDKTDDFVVSQLRLNDFMTKVKTEKFIFFEDAPIIHEEMGKDCNLQQLSEQLHPAPYAIALQKNSAYKPLINKASRWILESGVLDKIRTKYLQHGIICDVDSGRIKLSLNHTGGIFQLLFIGCIVSLFVYIVERYIFIRLCQRSTS